MNETTKTLVFVAIAAAVVSGAILGRPGRVGVKTPDMVGQALFAEFDDPGSAERLTVMETDRLGESTDSFEVARKQGAWVIPSHQDYPADATDNLKAVATMFIDLEVLNVASKQAKDHSTYGVLDPSEATGDGTGEDYGKFVRLEDDKGKRVVELIIGKAVADRDDQYYVRIPKQANVYIVKIDPGVLSTDFADWIEQDVMDLNPMDIETMLIRDYSMVPTQSPEGYVIPDTEERLRLAVRWNADDFKWDLVDLQEDVGGELSTTQLLENEQLDKTRLDEMKNALADLKIIDVSAKPAALRSGLKEDLGREIWRDQEGAQSLVSRGFYPDIRGITNAGIISTDGEVSVVTKEGVEYKLLFGGVIGGDAESDGSQLNRFVMIQAGVHEPSFPYPDLQDVPEVSGPEPAESDTADEASETESASADDDPSTDDEAPAVDEGEASTDDDQESERDRILKENQRLLDEYEANRKKAQDKADALNLRFADWYYVISEEVYKDVHLTRMDVVEVKEATADDGVGPDALRLLEEEGLQRESASSANP